MLKKTLSAIITVIMLFSVLSSCDEAPNAEESSEHALFDENGNMLCDYYVLNVLINGVTSNPSGGYYYIVHRYQKISEYNNWKDLVSYGTKIDGTGHCMAIYTNYGRNEQSIRFPHYDIPKGGATALKMIAQSELPNSGVSNLDEEPYFCAEVLSVGADRIKVAPLDGSIEAYISKKLSVSTAASGIGIPADELSVGDRIRIFYDGGIFLDGINIRGVYRYELLSRVFNAGNKNVTVSFLGFGNRTDAAVADIAVNAGDFTDGTLPGALPVSVIESEEELLSYFEKAKIYPSKPNSKYILNSCDFGQESLIAVYLRSPSISYTYGITELTVNKDRLTLKVAESNAPPMPIDEGLCYVIFIEAKNTLIGSITDFDVTLTN